MVIQLWKVEKQMNFTKNIVSISSEAIGTLFLFKTENVDMVGMSLTFVCIMPCYNNLFALLTLVSNLIFGIRLLNISSFSEYSQQHFRGTTIQPKQDLFSGLAFHISQCVFENIILI